MTFLEAIERGVDEEGGISEIPHHNETFLKPIKMLFGCANDTIMAVFQKIYELSGLVPVWLPIHPYIALCFYPIDDLVYSPSEEISLSLNKYEYRFPGGGTSCAVLVVSTDEAEYVSPKLFPTIFKMLSGLKIATYESNNTIVFEFPEFNTPKQLLMKLELRDYGKIS